MAQRLLSFFILFFLFVMMIKSSNGSRVKYGANSTHCPSFVCGGITIGYPFWKSPDMAYEPCGYPGLGVQCSTILGNKSPMISLVAGGTSYRVRDINYDNQTLTVVDDEVANQRCPRPRHNFTLLEHPSSALYLAFSYHDTKLTFYLNCTSSRFGDPSVEVIPCLQSGEKRSYFNYQMGIDDHQWFEDCDEKVETWVTEDAYSLAREKNRDVGVVLGETYGKGFLLKWGTDSNHCIQCENSGGWCLFDQVGYFGCVCPGGYYAFVSAYCRDTDADRRRRPTLLLKIMLGGVALLVGNIVVVLIYCYYRMPSFCKRSLAFLGLRPKNENNVDAFITQYRFSTPKPYKYSEIKNMTNAFKDELGRGGFGSVFKGTLADGSFVAVKVLKKSKASGEDFINEVACIGRTSHVNIVALKGFCYEGPKRALVYEFMANGSLEKFIFQNIPKDSEQYLGVEKLYEIALGIARGLEYLHRGCNTRILHFDIKPHNILLDEKFCPKISDFGLAKLHTSNESIISMVEAARGTIGYIAPEVYNRNFGGVSHKSDVYSYGMMVVEMVGGRKNLDVGVVHSSEIYFPLWIYKRLEQDKDLQLLQQGPMNAVENEIGRKMIIVGLWCIQADPSQRPSMNKVIEMLVGSTEALTLPPNPFFASAPQPPPSSYTTLESISSDKNLEMPE